MTDIGLGFAGAVYAKAMRFEEDGAGTYTDSVALPAGAVLLDCIVHAEALWTAATSASLEVGDDTDPDGYFTAVDLKATDLTLGQCINFAKTGGVEGAYFSGSASHIDGLYSTSARSITATIASVGAGTAGRTNVIVVYAVPVPDVTTQ